MESTKNLRDTRIVVLFVMENVFMIVIFILRNRINEYGIWYLGQIIYKPSLRCYKCSNDHNQIHPLLLWLSSKVFFNMDFKLCKGY